MDERQCHKKVFIIWVHKITKGDDIVLGILKKGDFIN
jgi:hypothetical protein